MHLTTLISTAGINMSSEPRLYGSGAWKLLRLSILKRDGYICAYCGQDATTVDHVIAVVKGGSMWDRDNLVACCSICNSRKRDKSLAVFLGQSSTPPVSESLISPLTVTTSPTSPVAFIYE